jgi:hypothetical protein
MLHKNPLTLAGVYLPLMGILAVLLWFGPLIAPDTGGYVVPSQARPPLYPYFLHVFRLVFGAENYWPVFVGQLFIGLYACQHLTQTLEKVFSLNNLSKGVVFFCLFSPYFLPCRFGNYILSEALAYPLFLWSFSYFCESLRSSALKPFLYFLGGVVLLVLTRRQFIFLYPFVILFVLYHFWRRPLDANPWIVACCALLAIGIAEVLDVWYFYVKWGVFAHAPVTWKQAVIAPLYLSTLDDVKAFTDPALAKIFVHIRERMLAAGIGYQPDLLGKIPTDFLFYQNYYMHYNRILYELMSHVLSEHHLMDPFISEAVTQKLTLNLLAHNYGRFIIFYILNIVKNIGGYFYGLLIVVGIGGGLFFLFRHPRFLWGQLLFWIGLANIGNYMAVALVEPAMKRYTAYTDTLQLALFVILILKGLDMAVHSRFSWRK